GGAEQAVGAGGAVGDDLFPGLDRERNGGGVLQSGRRVRHHFHQGQPRQHGGAQAGPKLLQRQPAQLRQARLARVGPEREELLAVGDGQLAERGVPPLVRHPGERRGGEREGRIPCRHQIGEVRRGDGRGHGRGFFFVVAVALVVSAFFVVSGAGGLGSSWTPLACPVTVHRSTLSPFR